MFHRQKGVKQLSAEELKSKLYAHFDKSGSLQQLRTQVRSQLVSELFKLAPPTEDLDKTKSETIGLDKKLLPLQVCNWLVYDHLLRQSYQYTLSTFVSETNLSHPDKLLTAGDVLLLFGLNNSTQEFKKISEMYSVGNKKNAFHSLLLAIVKSLLDTPVKDITEYEKQTIAGESKNDNKFQGTILVQNKGDIDDHNETLKFKSLLQSNELNTSASLESSFHEQLQSVKDEKEREIQNIRHKLLQELERLHLQERSTQLEFEQERKELKKERDLLSNDKEKLKEKETLFLKEQENKFERKVKELEEVFAVKLHSKEKEIENLRKRLLEKEQSIGQLEFELQSHRDRFDALKHELEEMNIMYKSVHEKYNSLLDENTTLVKKFQSMSDYDVVKEEISIKSKEIQNLKQKIEDANRVAEKERKAYTETVANLELKLRAIEPRLHQTQQELNITRDNLHMEETVWNKEKQKLVQESVTAKELYKTVLQRIEEQKQDIQDLHQTIHILHYQLTNKDLNSAVQADVLNKLRKVPKPDFLTKPSRSIKLDRNAPVNLSQRYRENALSFTADHRNRIHKLQQEVKANYDKYSLIYCSTLDDKALESDRSHTSNLFSLSNNLKSHSFPTTKLPGTSSSYFSGLQNESFNLRMNSYLNFGRNDPSNTLKEKYSFSHLDAETYSPNLQNTILQPTNDEINRKSILSPNQNINSLVLQAELLSLKKPDNCSSTNEKVVSFQESEMNYQVKTPVPKETYLKILSSKRSDVDTYDSEIPNSYKASEIQKNIESGSTNLVELETSAIKTKSQFGGYNSKEESILLENRISSQDNITFPSNNTKTLTSTDERELSKSSLHKSDSELETNQKQKEKSKNELLDNTSLKNIEETEPLNDFLTREEGQTHATSKQLAAESTQEINPIVIDLDAAWKRKTSLPSPPLFQTLSPSKSLVSDCSANVLAPQKELNAKDAKSLDIPSNETKESANKVISEELIQVNISSPAEKTIMPSSNTPSSITAKQSHTDSYHETSKITSLKDDKLSSETLVEFQVDQSVKESKQDIRDKNIKQNFMEYSSPKHSKINQLPEDSLSELSEVHMSCGSEQEQQKEDSDNNW